MPVQTMSGAVAEYAIEVRRANGDLYYQETSVMFPELPLIPPPPTCYADNCIEQYKSDVDKWAAECKRLATLYKAIYHYHERRAAYCMRHKHDIIEEKYRTGQPAPTTLEEIKSELRKIRR